jgi:hypothetical protein
MLRRAGFHLPKKIIRTMKPTKNTATTEARISPVRRFFFLWSSGELMICFAGNYIAMTLVAAAFSLGGVS